MKIFEKLVLIALTLLIFPSVTLAADETTEESDICENYHWSKFWEPERCRVNNDPFGEKILMMMHKLRPENYKGEVLEPDEETYMAFTIINYCAAFLYNPSLKRDLEALEEFKKAAKMIHEQVDSHTKFV